MKRRVIVLCLTMFMVISSLPAFAAEPTEDVTAAAESRVMENLNRGGFAATTPLGGVYMSWRLLGTEPMDTVFNIYKNDALLEANYANTNYTDAAGTSADVYTVAAVIGGVEGEKSEAFPMLKGYENSTNKSVPFAYFDIPVQIPENGSSMYNATDVGHGEAGGPNDASVGDVDGDGEYEIILKWDPSNSKDSSNSGVTGFVYIDCYEMDGTLLWRVNLGRNIRAGAHYTQFQVYDYDGDGKAEMAVKTAPGSIDGKGRYVSEAGNTDKIRNTDNEKSYLGSNGHVTGGPEYLTIFNGETGCAMQTIDFGAPLGNVRDWGDDTYNRSDRFLAGTAYLDGVHPSIIMCRGYYGKSVVIAYDWDGTNITQRWKLDSTSSSSNKFYGQGNHNLSVADLDLDGKDEIAYGSAAIDDDGTLLWSTGWGHGDAMHVSDFDNDGKQEIFKVNEDKPNWGRGFIDGDGTINWLEKSTSDDSRGIMAVFSKKYGALAWDSGHNVRTIDGTVVNVNPVQDNKQSYPNFSIYWDGDLCSEHFDGNRINKWSDYEAADENGNLGAFGRLWNISGIAYNNSTKKNPCLQADLLGDWREELILRTNDNSALRVFTSLAPSDYRFTTLMHDSQYRCAIAWQNTGYNQPPHQSYYIGYEKDQSEYTQPDIFVRPLDPEITLSIKDESGAPAAGVNVSVGGIEKPTNSNGEVSYHLTAGTYEYSVVQSGYYDVKGSAEVKAGAENSADVTLTVLPDSTITVTSGGKSIAGAKITAGEQTVVTDEAGTAMIKLKPGENTIAVECSGYKPYSDTVTVPSDKGADISIKLIPEPPLDTANAVEWNFSGEPFVKDGAVNTAMFPAGDHMTDNVVDRFNVTPKSIVNVNGLTYVTANTDKNQFQGSNASFEDGTECTWSLKTSKSGTETDRVFTYTPSKNGVLKIYAKSGSGSNPAGVTVKQGGEIVGSADYAIGAAAQMNEFKVEAGSEVKIIGTGNTQYYALKFIPYTESLSDVIGYSAMPELNGRSVSAVVYNYSKDGKEAMFIAAAYENGVLAEAQTATAAAGGETPVDIQLEKEYTDVRYYLWDSATYQPYSLAY